MEAKDDARSWPYYSLQLQSTAEGMSWDRIARFLGHWCHRQTLELGMCWFKCSNNMLLPMRVHNVHPPCNCTGLSLPAWQGSIKHPLLAKVDMICDACYAHDCSNNVWYTVNLPWSIPPLNIGQHVSNLPGLVAQSRLSNSKHANGAC